MTRPNLPYPQFIALCGNPLSGKSTAASELCRLAGYELVDDGGPLRQIAMQHFGATKDDVYTQEGKLRTTVINGQEMTWRDVLGRIGNGIEAFFGADAIPEMAYRSLDPNKRYVFGSVRREQGKFHKSRGALILEIANPLAGPSPYEFDRYNPNYVDVTVQNDFVAAGMKAGDARACLQTALYDAIVTALVAQGKLAA